MTKEDMIKIVKALGNDADLWYCADSEEIEVILNDFEGFDDDWEEVYREYTNEKAVDAFEEMLEDEALEIDRDMYTKYYFDGFYVRLGYSSYDI